MICNTDSKNVFLHLFLYFFSLQHNCCFLPIMHFSWTRWLHQKHSDFDTWAIMTPGPMGYIAVGAAVVVLPQQQEIWTGDLGDPMTWVLVLMAKRNSGSTAHNDSWTKTLDQTWIYRCRRLLDSWTFIIMLLCSVRVTPIECLSLRLHFKQGFLIYHI